MTIPHAIVTLRVDRERGWTSTVTSHARVLGWGRTLEDALENLMAAVKSDEAEAQAEVSETQDWITALLSDLRDIPQE